MNYTALRLLLASLAVSSVVVAGCAADTTNPAEDAEEVGVSADELSSRAQKFLGSYAWRNGDSGAFVDFEKLSLEANGTYTAMVDSQLVDPNIACITSPCTQPESGRWWIARLGTKLKLRVNPTGPKPTRSYFVSIQDQTRTLTLSRSGKSTNLFFQGSSCANVRCTAQTHCEMQFSSGKYSPACIPNAPATCAVVLCEAGNACVEKPTGAECVPTCQLLDCAPGASCVDTSKGAECVPNPPATCAATLCAPGKTCVDKPTGAICVPNPPPATCAATLCAPGKTCVDKPTGAICVPAPTPCVKTGCSSQICADSHMFSTCEYRPEYACYQSASCERQENGYCGWTKTPQLTSCLGL